MLNNQLVPEVMWQQLAKITTPSECHCKCGTTFESLSHYVGKQTRSISRESCPSCGSCRLAYALPSKNPPKKA
jgi:hypothetical protein